MNYFEHLISTGIEYAPKIAGAIIVLILGFWIVNRIAKLAAKGMKKSYMELELQAFLQSFISIGLKVLVVFSAAGIAGIETASFVAVLAAAGFAIGLALQGSLSNFAAGILVLLFKPYRVGDVIATQGYIGTVREIQIFNTIITNLENRQIILPNSSVINGPIENINFQSEKQLDLVFGIGYDDDINKAKEVLENVIKNCPGFLEDRDYKIMVKELADSSVNFGVRFWTKTEDFWDANFYVHEHVKKAFDERGVSIPFPQLDLHMMRENSNN